MNILGMIEKIRKQGYDKFHAEARLCQDIVIDAISRSSLSRNVTVKGGVVMRSISKDARRATRDLDIDFIRYSLQDDSIELFIQKINCLQGIQITRIGDIEELKQQDYHGKRVHIKISDEYGNSIISKIDLGVHKNLSIEQEEYCFDICYAEDGASLLVNTKEQMFTEKLKSFLKFGTFSTRYKDIFDMYYLTDFLDKANLNKCFSQYIFRDSKMKEKNVQDVCRRISVIFKNGSYVQKLLSTDTNWLEMDVTIVIKKIQCFLEELVCIEKEEKVV